MPRKSKLTNELIDSISAEIALGVWDYVAAECVGISQTTFYRWLEEGQAEDADELKKLFWESVTTSKAKARATAEKSILLDKPDVWLMKGSARHRPEREGWSNESNVNISTPDDTDLVLVWGGKDEETEES